MADFYRWLSSRDIEQATIKVLQKERIDDRSKLKKLTDQKLYSLKSEHGLSVSQFRKLREARDHDPESKESLSGASRNKLGKRQWSSSRGAGKRAVGDHYTLTHVASPL